MGCAMRQYIDTMHTRTRRSQTRPYQGCARRIAGQAQGTAVSKPPTVLSADVPPIKTLELRGIRRGEGKEMGFGREIEWAGYERTGWKRASAGPITATAQCTRPSGAQADIALPRMGWAARQHTAPARVGLAGKAIRCAREGTIGRFLECEPKPKSAQSFFWHKNSTDVSSCNRDIPGWRQKGRSCPQGCCSGPQTDVWDSSG